jgi:hypothetical protein
MKAAVLAVSLFAALGTAYAAEPSLTSQDKAAAPPACSQGDLDATWILAFNYEQKPILCSVNFNKKGVAKGSCGSDLRGKAKIDDGCFLRGTLEIADLKLKIFAVISKDKTVMLGSIAKEGAAEAFSILNGVKSAIDVHF